MNPCVLSLPPRRSFSAVLLAVVACGLCLGFSSLSVAADGDTPAKAPAIPGAAKDIAKNPMIGNLVGEWEAKGELTGPDGTIYTVTEQWKGAVVSETTFVIDGKREINGGQTDYKWTIILHPDTGIYEATHVLDNSETQRFEGSFSEETRTMELVCQLEGGGTMKLVRVFTSEVYDTFDTEVTFTNEKGEVYIHGKLVSKKVKNA